MNLPAALQKRETRAEYARAPAKGYLDERGITAGREPQRTKVKCSKETVHSDFKNNMGEPPSVVDPDGRI